MNTATQTTPGRFDDAAIVLEDTAVTYGQGEHATRALTSTSLTLRDGEFVALVGPSGCGKSTILKLAAGLLPASEGYVFVGGREISARAARLGIAFQNATMLPWLSVRDNIMLPLKIVSPFKADYRSKKKTDYRERADALLSQVGLTGFGDKFPWQLSGGMLQRASLCRALIHEPRVLLLDEPFGALDQFTREELWGILQNLWLDKKPTVLLVTHDLHEAAYLASRVCIMSPRPGRIIEDRAVDFDRPRTVARTYDADFVGLMQSLRSKITHDGPASVGSA